jgi:GNAT superfamily N-acetyltransferase
MIRDRWQTRTLADKAEILAYLETDRLYAAYAVGDLEPGMFEQSGWTGAERSGRMEALTLLFRGLHPPALFLMGDTEGLQAILETATYPEQVYLTCRSEHLPMTHALYAWDEAIPMWRMVLSSARFRPVTQDCVRLEPAHVSQLSTLYALGGGGAFGVAQLEQGVFYGVLVEGQLVAAAGTHLVSPTYGVAAVGNVFTHPAFRRRGYGTATTSAVIAELLQHGLPDIILNVGQKNAAAIRIYQRLGFECYCPFLEGPAVARR